jgi:hypothetical protein
MRINKIEDNFFSLLILSYFLLLITNVGKEATDWIGPFIVTLREHAFI